MMKECRTTREAHEYILSISNVVQQRTGADAKAMYVLGRAKNSTLEIVQMFINDEPTMLYFSGHKFVPYTKHAFALVNGTNFKI